MSRGRLQLAAVLSVTIASGYAFAQRPFDFNALRSEPPVHNIPYDGRFTFARLATAAVPAPTTIAGCRRGPTAIRPANRT